MLRLLNLKRSGMIAWPVAIQTDEVKAVLLDSGREKSKIFENEEIEEVKDVYFGEGCV